MTIKPKTTRTFALSRRRMEMAADRWWEVYVETLPLFLEHWLEESPTLPANLIQSCSERATDAAELALDAYDERWPGL